MSMGHALRNLYVIITGWGIHANTRRVVHLLNFLLENTCPSLLGVVRERIRLIPNIFPRFLACFLIFCENMEISLKDHFFP